MTATTIMAQVRARMDIRSGMPSADECRRIREGAGLTQQDVADIIGATRGAVALWEQGRRTPRPGVRERYLTALDAMRQAMT